jgi:mannitol-1-phosphate/altronate dehydrogenase
VNDNKYKKLVLFGAGKIGRSFIGQLFGRNGYKVVFIDMYKPIIDELNTRGNYNVIIKSNKKDEVINIKNVRGVLVTDENRAVEEIANADLLAVSVGQQGLKSIFPLMAKGLIKRFDDLLARFANISLGNTIFRVGCNLFRKLGKEDRLAGVIHQALYYKLPYYNILQAYVHGCHFIAKDEQSNLFKNDKEFIVVAENGIEKCLKKWAVFQLKKFSFI